jgi:hypothetical protein
MIQIVNCEEPRAISPSMPACPQPEEGMLRHLSFGLVKISAHI